MRASGGFTEFAPAAGLPYDPQAMDDQTSGFPTDPEARAQLVRQTAVTSFRRLAMIVVGALAVMVVVAGGVMFGLYQAATANVPEYAAAVEIDPVEADTARRELESQLSTLVSDTQALPEWKSRVTARQINAWLALRLEKEFPGVARAGLVAPRVVLREGRITLAAMSTASSIQGVVSVVLRPMVTESRELALDIVSAKIGRLSLPIETMLAQIKETRITKMGAVRLVQSADGAAIVVDLERIETGSKRVMRLTGIDVRDGELLLRGESAAPVETPQVDPPTG